MSRGRGRGRGRGSTVTASSGLRIETASSVDDDEVRMEDEDTDAFTGFDGRSHCPPEYSRNGESTDADDHIVSGDASATSGGNHDFRFHSNSFTAPNKTPVGKKSTSGPSTPAMRFNGNSAGSTSPMFGVFQSRPGPASLPAISGSSPTELSPQDGLEDGKSRQRVRGKTYKTPTFVSRTDADPRATKEEEFIEAQNGNLGKRKRTRTALAYDAPKRKSRGRQTEGGSRSGGSHDSRDGSQEADVEMSDDDESDEGDMSTYGGTGA